MGWLIKFLYKTNIDFFIHILLSRSRHLVVKILPLPQKTASFFITNNKKNSYMHEYFIAILFYVFHIIFTIKKSRKLVRHVLLVCPPQIRSKMLCYLNSLMIIENS